MAVSNYMPVDQQVRIQLAHQKDRYIFNYKGQDYQFPHVKTVVDFLIREGFTTIRAVNAQTDGSFYAHSRDGECHLYKTKVALREALSQEHGSRWAETLGGKTHIYTKEKGGIRLVPHEEFSRWVFFVKVGSLFSGLSVIAAQLLTNLVPTAKAGELYEFPLGFPTMGNQSHPSGVGMSNSTFSAFWNQSPDRIDGGFYNESLLLPNTIFEIAPTTSPNITSPSFPSVGTFPEGGLVVGFESDRTEGQLKPLFYQRQNSTTGESGPLIHIAIEGRDLHVTGLTGGRLIAVYNCPNGLCATLFRSDDSVENNFVIDSCSGEGVKVVEEASGGFLIAFACDRQNGQNIDIFVLGYEPDGTARPGGLRLNEQGAGPQHMVDIAPLEAGGAIVVWAGNSADGWEYGVRARKVNILGGPELSEIDVNTETQYSQFHPSVAVLQNQEWVCVWVSQGGHDGDGDGVYGQRFNAQMSTIGSEFLVNEFTTGDQNEAEVLALSDGGWVVLWTSHGQDGDGSSVYGMRYNSAGEKVAAGTLASTLSSVTFFTPNTFTILASVSSDTSEPAAPLASTTASGSSSTPTTTSSGSTSAALPTGTSGTFSIPASSAPESQDSTTEPALTGDVQQPLMITDIIYGQSYDIYNSQGVIIAIFSITGGTGPYDSNNPGTLTITLGDGYDPGEQEILDLFSYAEFFGNFDHIVVEGETTECLYAVEERQGGQYLIILESTGCTTNGASRLLAEAVAAAVVH